MTDNPASMLEQINKKSKKGDDKQDLDGEAASGVYKHPDGCGIPTMAFRSALLAAAGAWKKPKGRGSMKSVLSHMQVGCDMTLLIDGGGKPIIDYDVDARRVVNRSTKGAIIKARPRFDEWSAIVEFEYDEDLVADVELIAGIFADAGKRIGVGSYRPEKNGWFGRFEVVEINGNRYQS